MRKAVEWNGKEGEGIEWVDLKVKEGEEGRELKRMERKNCKDMG